jgi:hypothetical protein
VAAKPQVTLDRQEPARDALAVGDCVPHVGDGGVVAALDHDGSGRPVVVLARPHLTPGGADAVHLSCEPVTDHSSEVDASGA